MQITLQTKIPRSIIRLGSDARAEDKKPPSVIYHNFIGAHEYSSELHEPKMQ